MMLDTSKPNAMAPLYVTYTANAENEITAIRAGPRQECLHCGRGGGRLPHEAVWVPVPRSDPGKKAGFISR